MSTQEMVPRYPENDGQAVELAVMMYARHSRPHAVYGMHLRERKGW